jgi:hypothetical protein
LEWQSGESNPDALDAAVTDELLELYDWHARQRSWS